MLTEYDRAELLILLTHLDRLLTDKILYCKNPDAKHYIRYTLNICEKQVTLLKCQTIANFCEN